jgi:hypothetical protein
MSRSLRRTSRRTSRKKSRCRNVGTVHHHVRSSFRKKYNLGKRSCKSHNWLLWKCGNHKFVSWDRRSDKRPLKSHRKDYAHVHMKIKRSRK